MELAAPEIRNPEGPARDARQVFLAPGSQVLITRVQLPTRKPAQVRQALPYALEDQLADEPDQLHVVPGSWDDEGRLQVAVVALADMKAWLADLHRLGFGPRIIVPENAMLPSAPGTWTLWMEEGRCWLGDETGAGLCGDRSNACLLLDRRWHETPPGQRPGRLHIIRHGSAQASDDELGPMIQAWGLDPQWTESPHSLLEDIAARWTGNPAFNLFTESFGSPNERMRLWRSWRLAAGLLLSMALVHAAGLGWELHQLSQQSRQLEARILDVFRQSFPEARVVDPRRQMEAALRTRTQGNEAADGAGLTSMLGMAAPILADEPGLEVQALRFQPGRLDLDLELQDLQSLDRIKARLEQQSGWIVEIQSASTRAERVEGRLLLRSRGS